MLERRLRVWTGLVIGLFVLSHLGNHALGVLGMDFMEGFRKLNAGLWQSLPGTVALYGSLLVAQPVVDARFGLYLTIAPPTLRDLVLMVLVIAAGFLAGAVPAYRAYRNSLADGMIVRT